MISVGTVHIWCTDIQASKNVIHIKLLRSKQGGQSQTGWHGGGVERSMRVEGWRSEEKRNGRSGHRGTAYLQSSRMTHCINILSTFVFSLFIFM